MYERIIQAKKNKNSDPKKPSGLFRKITTMYWDSSIIIFTYSGRW